jgi:1,4-dihydroxy-2-naphthoate octaprenyltransferase
VFDAGALGRTGLPQEAARRATLALFAGGALLGLVVVAATRDALLLLLGLGGAFLAYSYSGPPLKLSYRGVGEAATFLAFGPLMVWGAYRAQAPGGPWLAGPTQGGVLFLTWEAFWVGLAFGALAAMVSFARYFPAEEEDRKKGKRTPVVALGAARASRIFAALAAAAAACLALAFLQPAPDACSMLMVYPPPPRPGLFLAVAAVAAMLVGARAWGALRSGAAARVEGGVRATVLLHLGIALTVAIPLLPSAAGLCAVARW